MKICIAGGPKTGKTTLGQQLAAEHLADLYHTDDIMIMRDWHGESLEVSNWIDKNGSPWVIEGVVVPRALRKWLLRNPTGKPCETFIWLSKPHLPLSKGQESMAKGCLKVWNEIEPELIRRGVKIERR